MSTVADEVRRARRGAGLTQKDLAGKLGVESITVSRWERGVTTPSLPRLREIAVCTETNLAELVRGSEASPVTLELAALRDEVRALAEAFERFVEALRGRQAA